MHDHLQKLDDYISEIKKILSAISAKDISTPTISSMQLLNKWLDQIKALFTEMAKTAKSPESTPEARADAQVATEQTPDNNKTVRQEMTAMAGGNGQGVAGGIDLGTDKEKMEEEEEDDEDSLFLKEGTLPLRQIIRQTISKLYESNKSLDFSKLYEELGLTEPPQVGAPPQQPERADTGGELAKQAIFPQINNIIQKQYTMLKTNEAQRQAFTKQLMKALEYGVNKLQVDFNVKMAGGGTAMQTDIGDKNDEDVFYSSVDIPGIDPTGKSFALTVYSTVFPKIKTALNGEDHLFGLTDPSDRRSFVKTIVDMTRELLSSLEEQMSQAGKPPAPAPSQAVAPLAPAKTNSNSNFLMP